MLGEGLGTSIPYDRNWCEVRLADFPKHRQISGNLLTDIFMKLGKSTFSTWLIVLAAIGLAAAPVIADQFRNEVARWYLAEASNRLVSDRDSTHQLEQARRWAENVTDLRDYWIFRCEQALADSPKKVAAVIDAAVALLRS